MAAKPVVVGVDGSEESLRAVAWGAREAQLRRAPLRIVSVAAMPPRMRAHHGTPQTVADALQEVSVRAVSEAAARAGEVAPNLSVDTEVLSGPPATAITESGSGAVMLVVGTRGEGRVRRDAPRFGQQVRGRARTMPGHRGPARTAQPRPRPRGGRSRQGLTRPVFTRQLA
jgi:nucleotide-binding universal stress UspA family protein